MKRIVYGKFLYGAMFVVMVPAVLVWWAVATTPVVPLPVIPYAWAGYIVIAVGLALMVAGMAALLIYGRGLPMNPYPPSEYVTHGIYSFTPHPIYVGFVISCFGVAILLESPSGLWLVSPMVALALTALVLGYERHDLRRRFGAEAIHTPLVSLPPDRAHPPTRWNRASIYMLVLIPWAVAFEAVYRLGVPTDAVVAYLPFERNWPVLEWTEAIYGSVYLLVLSTPLILATQRDLRRLAVMGLIATAVVSLIYLTVPVIAPPRPFEPRSILGLALMVERAMSHTVAAFPAFHVIWSFIAAHGWSTRSRAWGAAGWTWAVLIAVSCITTGMHALADIVAATVVFILLLQYRRIWQLMRRVTGAVANSWHEWRWHGVRLINYGLYAGLAGAVGFWISASLGGPHVFWQLVFVHLCGLVGAGLWAQQLEGSPKLARPFGYYGGVTGATAGAILAGAVAGNTIALLALIAMEAPWLQALGRLRCLVQGCCHGSEAPEGVGIRYWKPRSRVCVLAGLRGVPLHPTPLYSILANLVIGVLLLRLWSLGASFGLVAGTYLMLAGVARFVEESYRGEPQTPVVGGLRIYQWMAVLSIACGMALTTIPSSHPQGLAFALDSRLLLSGALYGLLAGSAMGLDFPGSARRFARLASP
ncbi:MAG: prolipoprotein diacylglyceryl transferase family protein [Gemmatimonadales bacterium]